LVALEKAPSKSGKTYWKCQCDCGTIKEVQTGHLKNGTIQSCGCNAHQIKRTEPVVAFRQRIKIALVEAFGHKCACCGLEDNVVLYDFHHINPEMKSFGISNASTTRSKQAYLDEAKKCVMLCANCHRRIENNLISMEDITPIAVNEKIYFQTLEDLLK
jgi:hypothetical protein